MFIPEQSLVTAMRDDVVNHRCRGKFTCLPALRAERMFLQKGFSRSAPLGIVTSGIRTTAHAVG